MEAALERLVELLEAVLSLEERITAAPPAITRPQLGTRRPARRGSWTFSKFFYL